MGKKILNSILDALGLSLLTIGISGLARIGWDMAAEKDPQKKEEA